MASASASFDDTPPMPNSDFDKITGLVENIFVDDGFQTLHNDYCLENWKLFAEGKAEEDSSELERKSMERFRVFRAYSMQVAAFLETELKKSMGEDFEVHHYIQEVEARVKRAETEAATTSRSGSGSGPGSPRPSDNGDGGASAEFVHEENELAGIEGEIFDMLLTLKDYARFQELMVDYAKMMEGQTPVLDDVVSFRKISDDEADAL